MNIIHMTLRYFASSTLVRIEHSQQNGTIEEYTETALPLSQIYDENSYRDTRVLMWWLIVSIIMH